MNRAIILYNPYAGSNRGAEEAKKLDNILDGKELGYFDITEIQDYETFLSDLETDDDIVICGGDGTLSRFINDTESIPISNNILYFATGSGNDFLTDLGMAKGDRPVRINEYLNDLPIVSVNGKECRFLNAIGYGIDGYCCEVGDELKAASDKPVNYASIAVKGLLFHYRPTNATITVDGKTYRYDKVWLAPTMNGRFYGGGMMAAPEQQRENTQKTVSLMVIHGAGRLRTLCMFPSIFKGEHVNYTNMVNIHTGHNISVEFDRETALQIDGETILDVQRYEVRSAIL